MYNKINQVNLKMPNLDYVMLKKAIEKKEEDNKPKVFIVRHAKTALNNDTNKSQDKIRGWENVPLDEEGIEQTKKIGKEFKDIHIDKIYSSNLDRAYDTAKQISENTNIDIIKDQSFRPWNLGEWQGQESKKVVPLLKEYIENPDKKIKDGETFNEFKDRFFKEFKKILNEAETENKNIVVVTHYRDIKLISAWIVNGADNDFSINIDEFLSDHLPTGSRLILSKNKDNKWYILKTEKTSHLKISVIRKLPSGKYQVQSEKGKNLGTYDSKKNAEERLIDVEYFKHKDDKK